MTRGVKGGNHVILHNSLGLPYKTNEGTSYVKDKATHDSPLRWQLKINFKIKVLSKRESCQDLFCI